MKTKKLKSQGFTLIEIITTIAIIAVIAVIGFTYANNYKLTQFNVRRKADITNLESTVNSYYAVNKKYPEPAGNKQYYDKNGTYTHSNSGAYGVSGFVTSEVFGKQFLSVTPKDPLTNNFYAYAKTYGEKPSYQFATAFDEKGTYFAYVKGNYSGEDLAGIIKEYNGPNFVIDKSSKYLPYNTYEVKLTGKINSYSGDVTVTVGNIDKELAEGDEITVGTGGLATIYLSDGSEIQLGSNVKKSVLQMNSLKYTQDDNLITKVGLKLTLGEIWVKAPELENGSELTVETSNAAASVRGTVFGLTTNGLVGSESIELIEGKLQLQSITSYGLQSYFNVTSSVAGISLFDYTIGSTGALRQEYTTGNPQTIMEALPGKPIKINYKVENIGSNPQMINGSSGTISPEKIDSVMKGQIQLNEGYIPNIKKINKTDDLLSLEIDNLGANWVELYTNSGGYLGKKITTSSGLINLTGSVSTYTGELAIRLCRVPDKNECSVKPAGIQSNIDTTSSPTTSSPTSYNYDFIDKAFADGGTTGGNKSKLENNYRLYIKKILFSNKKDTNTNSNYNTFNKTTINAYLSTTKREISNNTVNQDDEIFSSNPGNEDNGEMTINNTDTGGICTQSLICSQYKTIDVSNGDISADLSNNGPCTNGQELSSITNECEDTGLVAYAPYNATGDLRMFGSGGEIKTSTGNYIWSQSLVLENACIPAFSGSDFKSGDCSGSGTVLANSGYIFNVGNSFFTYGSTKGIFIDNYDNDNDDHVTYNINSLGLSGSFAIEMSVRGAALKRTSGKYYLFSVDDIKTFIYEGKLKINTGTILDNSFLSGVDLEPNTFYKVIFDNNTKEFKIKSNNGDIKYSTGFTSTGAISTGSLYIGNDFNGQYLFQWNDIIDYVKIYKY